MTTTPQDITPKCPCGCHSGDIRHILGDGCVHCQPDHEWEKEFDNKFKQYDSVACGCGDYIEFEHPNDELKDFIRITIEQEKEKALKNNIQNDT